MCTAQAHWIMVQSQSSTHCLLTRPYVFWCALRGMQRVGQGNGRSERKASWRPVNTAFVCTAVTTTIVAGSFLLCFQLWFLRWQSVFEKSYIVRIHINLSWRAFLCLWTLCSTWKFRMHVWTCSYTYSWKYFCVNMSQAKCIWNFPVVVGWPLVLEIANYKEAGV